MSSLFGLVFLIPFVGAGLIGPGLILFQGEFSPALMALIGAAAVLGLLNVIFYQLLRAPTEMGQKLLDQIAGFRLYLSTAEEERLKVLHPPEKTPELFERYLPYALALDCENEWNAKFATVLAAAAAAGAAAGAASCAAAISESTLMRTIPGVTGPVYLYATRPAASRKKVSGTPYRP